jgi:hypothetical protein
MFHAGPPSTQVIQRCHRPSEAERLEVCCRYGAGEADMPGCAGDQPQHDQRVQAQGAEGAVTQLAVEAVAQTIGYCQDVGQKHEVEAARLQQPAKVLIICGG